MLHWAAFWQRPLCLSWVCTCVYDSNIGLVFFNLMTSSTVAGFSRMSNLRQVFNQRNEDDRTPDEGEDDKRIIHKKHRGGRQGCQHGLMSPFYV